MNQYKIVASDLDGTLLNSESKISSENLEAIQKLVEKGVLFVPSSGRTYSEIVDEIKNNMAVRYYIHSNGAVVWDRETGKRILTCVSREVSQKILDFLKNYEVHLTYRHNGESYVDARFQDEGAYAYYNVHELHRRVVRQCANYLENFEETIYSADNIEVFSVYFHDYDEKMECKKHLEKWNGIRVVEADQYNLEIMNVDAGKGNALYMLADMLGIDRTATISIGDSDNDASITQAAGLGLAVSNARASLKEVADKIICSNDEHAIAYVLSHYFE